MPFPVAPPPYAYALFLTARRYPFLMCAGVHGTGRRGRCIWVCPALPLSTPHCTRRYMSDMVGMARSALETVSRLCRYHLPDTPVPTALRYAPRYKNGEFEFCMKGTEIHKKVEAMGGLEKITLDGWCVCDACGFVVGSMSRPIPSSLALALVQLCVSSLPLQCYRTGRSLHCLVSYGSTLSLFTAVQDSK
jgi:hypothetical protein